MKMRKSITRVIVVLFKGGWVESHVIKWQQRAKQTSMVLIMCAFAEGD